MRQDDYSWARALGSVSSIGLLILVSVGIGLGIGYWLDKTFHTSPWFMFVGTLLGLAAGLVEVVKILLKANQ